MATTQSTHHGRPLIDLSDGRPPCPHCHSCTIYKGGTDNLDRQMYHCLSCGRWWTDGAILLPPRNSPGVRSALLITGDITRREWLRFLSHITPGPDCPCTPGKPHRHWLWHEGNIPRYGTFKWRGKNRYAHTFAYIALWGAIPTGMEPDHLCGLTACANPACLEIVPARINKLRSINNPFARNARKTACIHGHALAGENLSTAGIARGIRLCLTCQRERQARWRKEHGR